MKVPLVSIALIGLCTAVIQADPINDTATIDNKTVHQIDTNVTISNWELENDAWLNVSDVKATQLGDNDMLNVSEIETSLVDEANDTNVKTPWYVSKLWKIARRVQTRVQSCYSVCSIQKGKAADLYWKYLPDDRRCDIPDQKTIGGVVLGIMRALNGKLYTFNYCVALSHGNKRHGTFIVGSTSEAWKYSCDGVYNGEWDMGSESLAWTYNSTGNLIEGS